MLLQKLRRREVLFTTLIDMLLQCLFIFLFLLAIYGRPEDRALVNEARKLEAIAGRSLFDIKELWSRLIDPAQLDEKQKRMLAQLADYERLKKLEQELNDQERFLTQRRAELDKRRQALGQRPCWETDAGQVEFLFNIDVNDSLITVDAAWPERREIALDNFAVPKSSLSKPLETADFETLFRPIYEASKGRECRHYALLQIRGTSAEKTMAARAAVENLFYIRLRTNK